MRNLLKASAIVVLTLFCFHFSKAQAPEASKNMLGLNVTPLWRGGTPELVYNRALKTGFFRTRLHLSGSSFSTHESLFDQGINPEYNTRSLSSFLAIGWQNEKRINAFGLYYGADIVGGVTGSKSKRFDQDAFSRPDTVTTQFFRGNSKTIEYGIDGIVGVRYHFPKHFSIGLESGIPARFTHRRDQASSSLETEINGNVTVSGETFVESFQKRFSVTPFRTVSVMLNFHF